MASLGKFERLSVILQIHEKQQQTSWGWVGPSSRLVKLELSKKFEITFGVVDEVKVTVNVHLVHLVGHLVP